MGPTEDLEVRCVLKVQALHHHELGGHVGVLGNGMDMFVGQLKGCEHVVAKLWQESAQSVNVLSDHVDVLDEQRFEDLCAQMTLEASCVSWMAMLETNIS